MKPGFVPVAVPDETTVSNKYYIDMTSGGGSACSQSAPCTNISAVYGKAGTTGGPAYIYVKGTGSVALAGTLYGASGSEIVITPWPGASGSVIFQSNASNYIESANISYLIFDGGPNLLFQFQGNSGYSAGNSNGFALNINSNNLTFARRLPG